MKTGLRTEGMGVIGSTGRPFEFLMTTDAPDGPYDLSALVPRNDAREPISSSDTSSLARAMSQLRHLLV
jgi:hypothetical protein